MLRTTESPSPRDMGCRLRRAAEQSVLRRAFPRGDEARLLCLRSIDGQTRVCTPASPYAAAPNPASTGQPGAAVRCQPGARQASQNRLHSYCNSSLLPEPFGNAATVYWARRARLAQRDGGQGKRCIATDMSSSGKRSGQ